MSAQVRQLSITALYRVISVILVSIGLTVVQPDTARSAVSCGELFKHESVFAPKEVKLEVLAPQKKASAQWQGAFAVIKNFRQLADLLSVINKELPRLSAQDLVALQQIDLIAVVNRFNSKDIESTRRFVNEIVGRVDAKAHRSPLGDWVYPLQFHFFPEKILQFVEKIEPMSKGGISFQEAFSGYLGMWGLNQTLSAAIANLPPVTRSNLIRLLNKKVQGISLNSELMEMTENKLDVPYQRLYRRNLEVMAFLLSKKDLGDLKARLSQSSSLEEITKAIDRYYENLDLIYKPKRGGYRASQVIKSAQILQVHFAKYLKGPADYIDLYGSFPNGKATFKTSDIDIKFSETLLKKLTGKSNIQMMEEPFSLFFSDMVERNRDDLSDLFFDFWKAYRQAESDLGNKVFLRNATKDSELLTTLYPPRQYTNDVLDFRWYNPIVMRIFSTKVVVQIYDLMGSDPSEVQFDIILK